ncbi:MAG: ABC transporter substrate-binding protein [Rhodospirillales bacterium]|nr:MAG: ABC transporter substrate-binding protein [Rhodospirillales bacterium]
MTDRTLTLACVATDRSRPILDGRVTVPGVTFAAEPGEPEAIFRTALREHAFDVTELSMSSHITVTARGDAHYVGVPVFLSRAFRHSGIYVRTDRGIDRPEDLKGRTIGLPEYQQTAALWVRGILRDLHGVGVRDVRWRIGGVEQTGQGERIRLDLPGDIDVEPIGPDETLNGLLADGAIDAIISPRPPSSLADPDVPVARLFADYRAAEIAYHKQTGFFPIMHCLALRRALADEQPDLPGKLFRAFAAARDLALAELGLINVLRVSLPWVAAALAETQQVMGPDIWPYGFRRNRDEIAAMTRYAHEDGLTDRRLEPESLFHPSTLDLTANDGGAAP